jgi:hypothetical protein
MAREGLTELVSDVKAVQGRTKRLGASTRVTKPQDLEELRGLCRSWWDGVALALPQDESWKIVDTHFHDIWEKTLSTSSRASAYSALLSAVVTGLRGLIRETENIVSHPKRAMPDLSRLMPDRALRENVVGRWQEVELGLGAGTYLASTVMMGSILEAALIARMKLDQSQAMTAASAPREFDAKKGKVVTKALETWMLNDLIGVAEERAWISTVATGVSRLLRDWRNLIHPNAQLRRGVRVGRDEAALLWVVCTAVVTDLAR